MKKKGFTLIELLAVIVILAIIALIATPVILGIINNVKEEANKRSIEMYAKAIENAIALNQLTNPDKIIGSFDSQKEGKELVQKGKPSVNIDYDGKVECDTIEIYADGSMYIADCKVDGKSIDYTYGKQIFKKYNNGEEVYFDVVNGTICENYHEDNSKIEYNGIYEGENSTTTTNNQNSCLKFYAFLDDGSDKINLLLDHNTTAAVAWTNSTTATNANGPIDVVEKLYEDTKDWGGIIIPSNYEYNGSVRPYTVNYSGYKARLITAQEIAKITGADKALNWNEIKSGKGYYLDGAKGTDSKWNTQVANSTNQSEYYWLFDRTSSCLLYGCRIENLDIGSDGYWTSSAISFADTHAWKMSYLGYVSNQAVKYMSYAYTGIRPVITVHKSNLKK